MSDSYRIQGGRPASGPITSVARVERGHGALRERTRGLSLSIAAG